SGDELQNHHARHRGGKNPDAAKSQARDHPGDDRWRGGIRGVAELGGNAGTPGMIRSEPPIAGTAAGLQSGVNKRSVIFGCLAKAFMASKRRNSIIVTTLLQLRCNDLNFAKGTVRNPGVLAALSF